MLENIYPYLILSGCTIGVVLLYLWRHALDVNHLNLALIELNQAQDNDTLKFLNAVWPILSRARLRGMRWQLQWYGVPVNGEAGDCRAEYIEHSIEVTEMHLRIQLFLGRQGGEQRYFTQTVLATLLLLLRTDMLIKASSTHSTFVQMAKLNLFLQHDIKNIAQFIQLMADQLENMRPEQGQIVLDNLRAVAPLVRQRADRIVHTLTAGQEQNIVSSPIYLLQQSRRIAQLFHIELQSNLPNAQGENDFCVQFPERSFDCALENILKNYHDLAQREAVPIPIISLHFQTIDEQIEMRISAHHSPPDVQLERLFEPFWSSDPAGLGIGLYQAKQLLEASGASLHASKNQAGQLEFILRLPYPNQLSKLV